MKYIFINPVVAQMYEKESLDKVLLHNGYQRVEVEKDWHGIVKEKYQKLLQETNLPIIDRRCPKAVESIAPYLDSKKMVVPTIEPILIHCAMELAGREDLKKYKKVITTPCESLARHGNKIGLENTEFISWKELLKELKRSEELKKASLDKSPIPPGYFKTLGVKVSSLSEQENIENHFKMEQYKEDEIVEMLYCHNGCHNGDGVLVNE